MLRLQLISSCYHIAGLMVWVLNGSVLSIAPARVPSLPPCHTPHSLQECHHFLPVTLLIHCKSAITSSLSHSSFTARVPSLPPCHTPHSLQECHHFLPVTLLIHCKSAITSSLSHSSFTARVPSLPPCHTPHSLQSVATLQQSYNIIHISNP